MNFIFDIGNVLIDFKPRAFLEKMFASDEEGEMIIDKINDIIFKSQEWVQLDLGDISHNEALDIFSKREPNFEKHIKQTMERIKEMLTPIQGTIDLLPKIKEMGHDLYYLSNYHTELSRYILEKYEFFKLFNGGIFSCDVNIVKPSVGIYERLLDKYNLNPKECIFFDDSEENVRSAEEKLGIKGVLFTCPKDIEIICGLTHEL